MTPALLALTFLVAILDWSAVYKKWQRLEYFCKPATLALLFTWLVVRSGLNGNLLWFGLGLLFSLAGDVFLMFSERWFIAGLLAFLLAHLAYIIGFNIPLLEVSFFWGLAVAVVLSISAARLLRRILAGLAAKGLQKLRLPVQVYGTLITLMLLSAILTLFRPEWGLTPAALVSLGALSFYFSDVILAWNRFVNPIRQGRLLNMVAYHLGQIALIAGAAMHFTH
jgi:alkenylglycerophosphocholine/alkenylglycerophosphoethanolamine hydrolase